MGTAQGAWTQHRAGDSPLQPHCAPQPVPSNGWLPCHIDILQQEERSERPEQRQHRSRMAPASPRVTQHGPSTHSPQPQCCGSLALTMFSRKAGTRVALGSTTKASAEPKRAPCRALGWQESRGCRRAQRCSSIGRLGKCCCSWQSEGRAGTELPWHCQHPAAPQPGSDNTPHPAHIPAASHPMSHLPAAQHSCVLSQLHLILNPISPTSHPMPQPACIPSQTSHPSHMPPHGLISPTPRPPVGRSSPCSLCSASGGSAVGAERQQRLGCCGGTGAPRPGPQGAAALPSPVPSQQ